MNRNEQFAKFGERAFFNRIKSMPVLQVELVDQGTPQRSQVGSAIKSLPKVMSDGTRT